MFKQIYINDYRGLKHIELNNLGHINVIVGENNSGKTSILEAVQLLDNHDILSNIISIAKRRETQNLASFGRGKALPFEMFLYSFDMRDMVEKEIFLSAKTYENRMCRVRTAANLHKEFCFVDELQKSEVERYAMCADEKGYIRVLKGEYLYEMNERVEGNFTFRETQLKPQLSKYYDGGEYISRRQKILYISPMDIYTNKIISSSLYKGMLIDEKRRLIELLRIFDERIISIENGMNHGYPVIWIEMEDYGLVPISVFGDGLKKVLTLASAVVKMRDGVILIDEFETGIHKRALIQVAEWLATVTETYNVQVFLTTHSSDAIEALVEAGQERMGVKAYRLEHYKDQIYVKEFEGTDLYRLCKYQGLDIL